MFDATNQVRTILSAKYKNWDLDKTIKKNGKYLKIYKLTQLLKLPNQYQSVLKIITGTWDTDPVVF